MFLDLFSYEKATCHRTHLFVLLILVLPLLLTLFLSSHCSGIAIDHDSGGNVTRISSVPIPSPSPSDIIQVSRNPFVLAEALLLPRSSFKLATYNVQTLMRVGEQDCLVRALDILAINVCCIQ